MRPSKPIEQELTKAKQQLEIIYEISNAMRTTLKLDEILYVILTAATAHAGLAFNRAMLFLVNEKEKRLEGAIGIGPGSGEEAQKIWMSLDPKRMTLDDLISTYKNFHENSSSLDKLVRSIQLSLNEESGIIALTALEGMPMEILTEEARNKLSDPLLTTLELERFVVVPLKTHDKSVGVLVVDNRFNQKPISKEDLRILMMFANQAGLAIENSKMYERTLLLSKTDSLTRLWNHGTFQQLLSDEIEKSRKNQDALSLAILDLDNFKQFNDSSGHQVGDQLLVKVANLLVKLARASDYVARYGGEEFAIIFPGITKEEAYQACERIRNAIEQDLRLQYLSAENNPEAPQSITVSIGLAAFPQDGDTKEKLIYASDMALLLAKRSGKNQTKLA
jgi:diguanylate cyclase (GGDEF)-like protein